MLTSAIMSYCARCKVIVILRFTNVKFPIDNGRTKPIPRGKKKDKNTLLEMEGSESKCLIRATNGKKKISTVVGTNC